MSQTIKKINYKGFIEKYFFIVDKEDRVVPFKLNAVQSKYYDIMTGRYPHLEGVREIVLKARQQGMSSFILAIFTVDFLLRPHSRSICISHDQDSTEMLFKKVKFYIQSYCDQKGYEIKDLLSTDNRKEMVNKANGASFSIMTAGSKVGGRGGTARNILFSETAFYPDVEKITAGEMIQGTSQMVKGGTGKIFLESTANGYGNYFQLIWAKASKELTEATERRDFKNVGYYPTFFGWGEFYTKEWIEQKKKEFLDPMMFLQEYPLTPDEAFISSGNPFFDMATLKWYDENVVKDPIKIGDLASDGEFTDNENPNEIV